MLDAYRLLSSAGSDESDRLHAAGLERYLFQQDGSIDLFERALVVDPEFGAASLGLALALRAEGRIPDANRTIKSTRSMRLNDREQSLYFAVLQLSGAKFDDADAHLAEHLRGWPSDALALQLRLFLLNLFSSRPDRDQEMLRCVRSTEAAFDGHPFFLSALAFALEEAREFEVAHDVAQEALRLLPNNARAAHACAHTFLETGAFEKGESFLDDWINDWVHPGVFTCHARWHQGLSALARADYSVVASRLDEVLAFVGRSAAVLVDGASLAWRLVLDERDDGIQEATSALLNVANPPGVRFLNAHHAMVLAIGGDISRLKSYRNELAALGAGRRRDQEWRGSLPVPAGRSNEESGSAQSARQRAGHQPAGADQHGQRD